MFRKCPPHQIVSDEGFSIEIVNRSTLRYIENDRVLDFKFEYLVGPIYLVLYPYEDMRWSPPYDGKTISKLELSNIIDNIRKSFRFDKKEIDVWGEREGEKPIHRIKQSDLDDLIQGNEKSYEDYLRDLREEWGSNK